MNNKKEQEEKEKDQNRIKQKDKNKKDCTNGKMLTWAKKWKNRKKEKKSRTEASKKNVAIKQEKVFHISETLRRVKP